MLIEIAEKEEEEDSTGRNDGKDIFKNQSDIYFNHNKKIFLKNHKKYDNESKNNEIIQISSFADSGLFTLGNSNNIIT